MYQSDLDNLNVVERVAAPTPKFFKKFAAILGTILAVSTAIVTLPVSVPAIVVTVAGYAIAGSTVGLAVCGMPVDKDKLQKKLAEQ